MMFSKSKIGMLPAFNHNHIVSLHSAPRTRTKRNTYPSESQMGDVDIRRTRGEIVRDFQREVLVILNVL